MLLPRSRALIATAVAPLLLAGCGGASGSSDAEHQAVAAFFPLEWVTAQVAGPEWDVTGLTEPGAEPHDLELGIAQTAELDEADLVVFEHEFQPAVDKAVAQSGVKHVVDAATLTKLESHGTSGHEGEDKRGTHKPRSGFN